MGLDLEQVMVLLQRRYNFLREIKRLTADLQDAVSREDSVSAGLILQMRADEMENIENCQEMIWRMAEGGQKENEDIHRLMSGEFLSMAEGISYEEDKILKLRKKTAALIKESSWYKVILQINDKAPLEGFIKNQKRRNEYGG